MDTRRDFLAKLVASGVGLKSAIKQSIPEAEIHKLEKDAIYILVVPDMTVQQTSALQKYMESLSDIPRFIVMPYSEVQIYKL